MTAAPGRGRPVLFDATAQAEFLRLLADGTRVGDAADKLGISRRTPTQLAARDPRFAEQFAAAKGRGRDARSRPENLKHGDPATYNNHACRCPRCTAAATAARTGHRHTARTDTTAQIRPLRVPQPTTATSKFLMLADVG
ncbi:hypothetical protein ACFW81_24085 [Streptomyces angustmyceticus]|uniref:hypothetical protein n=1 Tax=Streptomyces angustmyceticus TaxID=285578 RepID=UPI0036A8F031